MMHHYTTSIRSAKTQWKIERPYFFIVIDGAERAQDKLDEEGSSKGLLILSVIGLSKSPR